MSTLGSKASYYLNVLKSIILFIFRIYLPWYEANWKQNVSSRKPAHLQPGNILVINIKRYNVTED